MIPSANHKEIFNEIHNSHFSFILGKSLTGASRSALPSAGRIYVLAAANDGHNCNSVYGAFDLGAPMIPGELFTADGELTMNAGADVTCLMVANTGDRPIQIGSHFHFTEANSALDFDRDAAMGMRLDIISGTAVRFEPGQRRKVALIPLLGRRAVYGFNQKVMGLLS